MSFVLHLPDLRSGYVDLAQRVLREGHVVSPRGMKTYEVLGASFIVEDPTDTLPIGVGRKLNPAIGYVEALQLIGAQAAPELVCQVSSAFEQFREPNGRFWGAYGDRIKLQAAQAAGKLKLDRDSRQATITLWDPHLDNTAGKRDYPCTVTFQAMIRRDQLVLQTWMRSNDVVRGTAYDVFQFTQLQLTIAHSLGIEAGPYYHHAASLHIYERDLEIVEGLHPPAEVNPPHRLKGIGTNAETFNQRMYRARKLLRGQLPRNATHTERTMHQALQRAREEAT